jgi:hypothetical protein
VNYVAALALDPLRSVVDSSSVNVA